MYETILNLHSYFAFVVLGLLLYAVINAFIGFMGNKDFTMERDFRLSLFAFILAHIQLLVGFVLYFVSPRFALWGELGMGGIMKDSINRLFLVEHPFVNILAIALITIGWSKHKKVMESKAKFKIIAIFYGLGLVFFLSRIPWSQWLG
ncbi:MAG: hypothetical protein V3U92_07825 [Cellulophaga sp.]